ncbi:MAG: hypothetical protein HZB17_09170 [Chloroflexi bacterium]|nr:hypothetical protein [Chloroflexota bacterium]
MPDNSKRDPLAIAGFVVGVLSLVATAIGLVFALIFIPNRSLQFVVEQPILLVSVSPAFSNEISVYYQGTRVEKVYSVIAHLKNTGNQSIELKDYESPMNFSVINGAQIAFVNLTKTYPENINVSVQRASETRVELSPTLINQGEEITLQFVIFSKADLSSDGLFKVSTRISGISEVQVLSQKPQQDNNVTYTAGIFLAGLVIGTLFISVLRFDWNYFKFLRRSFIFKKKPELIIVSARYGLGDKWLDVSNLLRSKIKDGNLQVNITNEELGGDPVPNSIKRLEITYSLGGETLSRIDVESETLIIP